MDESGNGLFDGNDQILFYAKARTAGPYRAMSSVMNTICTPIGHFIS